MFEVYLWPIWLTLVGRYSLKDISLLQLNYIMKEQGWKCWFLDGRKIVDYATVVSCYEIRKCRNYVSLNIIHMTYKVYVAWFYVISRLLVSSRLLVVKFGESQKLQVDFSTVWGLVHLTSMLFKGQLYFQTQMQKMWAEPFAFSWLMWVLLVQGSLRCRNFSAMNRGN